MPTDWCGTGVAWTNTNSPWCGVGVPFGCTLPVLAFGSCVGSVQEFWFTAGNPPFVIYQSGTFLFTVNNLNDHFNIACGTEWCSVIPASAIDKCKINTTISPDGITLAGIISCTGVCDTTTKSSTKQFAYTPCYCGSGTVIWAVSGTGASISQSGLLTTTAAACGTLTITVTMDGCTVATQAVRVTNGGLWVGNGPQTPPLSGCTYGSNCGSGTCDVISGEFKDTYVEVQCQGASSQCGVVPCSPSPCPSCTAPNKIIWIYINHYKWVCP